MVDKNRYNDDGSVLAGLDMVERSSWFGNEKQDGPTTVQDDSQNDGRHELVRLLQAFKPKQRRPAAAPRNDDIVVVQIANETCYPLGFG